MAQASGTGINVYDVSTNTATNIYANLFGAGDCPRWSPLVVPERIAFARWGRVYTIAPDGTDLKVVYDAVKVVTWDQIDFPHWSPDGKYLACENTLGKMGKNGVGQWWYEIAIVPSQGGAKTILTADMLDDPGRPVGWRWTTPAP